ncbi:hypothetical protein HUU42_11735 [bacterium]|nr:hypothetical protein [bacterium]
MARFTKTSLSLEDAIIDAYLYLVEGTTKNLYDFEAAMGMEPVPVIGTTEEKNAVGLSSIKKVCFIEYPKGWFSDRYPPSRRLELLKDRMNQLLSWANLPKEKNSIQLWIIEPLPANEREELDSIVHYLTVALSFEFHIIEGKVLKENLHQILSAIHHTQRTYDNYLIRTVKFLHDKGLIS